MHRVDRPSASPWEAKAVVLLASTTSPASTTTVSAYVPLGSNAIGDHKSSTFPTHIVVSPGMHILAEKRMNGAEVDSEARKYSPRCHPETRKSLRGRITEWVEGTKGRLWRMLWVMGPAGVGKSAVAQSIAESMKTSGLLGATLFFSRPHRRDDPSQIVPTLAYQLAVRYPEYRPILNQRLANDPTLFEKTLRTQFKELIIDPFHLIMARRPSTARRPVLVVLDGLDECNSTEAQCELIECIADHVRDVHTFPLLWLVFSRSEWHLKCLLSQPDFPAACKREELIIDDSEARQDVVLFLRDGFKEIRLKFRDYLEPSWPPEAAVQVIIRMVSGLFALAGVVIRFVGDETISDPCAQFETCIKFLGGSEVPGATHPLHALDLLYRRICSNTTPSHSNDITRRILGVCVLYPQFTSLPAQDTARFLGVTKAEFYNSLKHLHSVLEIPAAVDAHKSAIRFHHTSFKDYLEAPNRSREYTIDKGATHYDVATCALRWQSFPEPQLTWKGGSGDDHWPSKSLVKFAPLLCWRACSQVTGTNYLSLFKLLDGFDFSNLNPRSEGLSEFLIWLCSSSEPLTKNIVHARSLYCPLSHSSQAIFLTPPTEDIRQRLKSLFFHDTLEPYDQDYISLHLGSEMTTCEILVDLAAPSAKGKYITPVMIPSWLQSALEGVRHEYPDDRFERIGRVNPPSMWIKCLDCPGKVSNPTKSVWEVYVKQYLVFKFYPLGPGASLSLFKAHLRSEQHCRRVKERLGLATVQQDIEAPCDSSLSPPIQADNDDDKECTVFAVGVLLSMMILTVFVYFFQQKHDPWYLPYMPPVCLAQPTWVRLRIPVRHEGVYLETKF
ncbi:hypothetical protein NP233_g8997 [Leucocoprinus birnbaumii]|uniref:NACHT domain-containing protein n=1 Tax=Leucocoprinus birnbaumii TaxID=56174 RepID=A0AAD5VLX9_9AGAR|nr:hypothetical protein NP233_g8997 [Leucocoprinus birnbaumii]